MARRKSSVNLERMLILIPCDNNLIDIYQLYQQYGFALSEDNSSVDMITLTRNAKGNIKQIINIMLEETEVPGFKRLTNQVELFTHQTRQDNIVSRYNGIILDADFWQKLLIGAFQLEPEVEEGEE